MMTSGYNIRDIIQEAQSRWLRPGEVLFVLQNYEENQLNHEPPQKPPSGSLFLFNKRVLRFFRKDGHSWRKKKDGKNVGEAHERLKVGNIEALNCYYAHGDQNPDFQRRSYWMLDPAMEHIVLVHYRDITIGRHSAGPVSTPLGSSSNIIKSSNSYATQLSLSATGGLGSVEASPGIVTKSNGASRLNLIGDSPSFEVDQAFQMIEQQLSLDHLKDIDTFYRENEYSNNLGFTVSEQNYSGSGGLQDGSNNYLSQQYPASILLPQELEDLTFPAYIPARNTYESDPDIYLTLFDQEQMGTPIASDSSLTIAQEQKFTIREISPEWGYANESTKVLVVGTFTCDPSKCEWFCMFGDTEVPVEIIQEGVICCQAPPRLPGKVTICITSGNREACSEVREFEYRDKPNIYVHNNNLTEREPSRGSEELLLLVKLVQLLLSDQVGQSQKGESQRTRIDLLESSRAGEDSWAQVIDAISDESLVSSRTTDWLLEELLKDKLQWWISSKLQDNNAILVLSKREQGIIHMISGLGFVWVLTPILKCGVGVNFRDVNGWTALHWAARFGREKMVAELLASGAYAGAVTDPSQQDPTGQTPASIAATYGHKGLAAYLSEIALTSHLSSLTLQETELSRCSADVEAESTVNTISDQNLVINEDHLSLKDAIAAVRNTIQAASRIQAAFRAHSFKKRKQKEAAECDSGDEYGFLSSEIEGLSASSKFTFGSARDHNAALSIQKKYRGWKGRKDFLTLRQKVVKIQAHVRGHQARKNYETICWAVSLVEKIILRWHRKGVGLRGFHVESLDENEDVVKVFRKQKVDVALSEAVSRVLSMVNSQPARQQYRRMLQKYRQAKAERGGLENEGGSTSQGDITSTEDDVYNFM